MGHDIAQSYPSKAFPSAGLYAMRSQRVYLFVACQPIGVNGNGPHKHNDWLSFEYVLDGRPVIIDPGTYCYTGNRELRRLFRSTSYHNTVVIDGGEQVVIEQDDFSLINPYGEVTVVRWESNREYDLLEAQHTGYTRLRFPVIHRRSFLLDKSNHALTISDAFLGEGEHTLEWFMHLEVGLICKVSETDISISSPSNPVIRLICQDWDSSWETRKGWVSRAYNQRDEAEILYSRVHRGALDQSVFVQRFYPIGPPA